MGVLTRFTRKKSSVVPEAESVARYRYLLRTLPPEVSQQILEAQFRALPAFRRQEILDQLRPFATEQERGSAPEPALLATVMTRAQLARNDGPPVRGLDPRDRTDPSAANWDGRLEAMVARQFMVSTVLIAYFANAGLADAAEHPSWVGETFGPDAHLTPDAGAFGAFGDGAMPMHNAGGYEMGGYDGGFGGGGGGDGGGM